MDDFEVLREKLATLCEVHKIGKDVLFLTTSYDTNMEAVVVSGSVHYETFMAAHAYGWSCITDLFTLRFGPDKDQVTTDEWVEACGWCFLKNPRSVQERWRHHYSAVFESLAQNNDGVFSFEEYKVFGRSNRLSDEEVHRAFKYIDANGDGVISKEEFVSAYLKYICDPTVSKRDVPLFG